MRRFLLLLALAAICGACDDADSPRDPAVIGFDAQLIDAALPDGQVDAARDAVVDDATRTDAMGADADARSDLSVMDVGPVPDQLIPDARPQLSEIERVRGGFGLMQTVAGRGEIAEKGDNGWQAEFEGGDAREAELSRPHMAMADAAGNLYIADKDAHAVRKVDTEGRISTFAGTSEAGDDGDAGIANQMRLNSPNGLWALPNGTVFILDLGNRAIRRVGPDGRLTTVLRDPAGMGTGRGLWVSPNADAIYYAAGNTVRRWTPDDGVENVVAGFVSLGNLTVDPDGHLVVTDRGAHRVYRIIDGAKSPIAGNGTPDGGGDGQMALATGLDEVRGVWFHPEGGYFLATHEGGQVWYVDTEGVIHRFVHGDDDRDTHGGDGERVETRGKKVSEVRAVTMAPDGSLLITENDRGFVRQVSVR